ncbi:hydrolase [Amylibacter kogurei]|uniref:Hydrolase n=1 Tax=Paramylibacter kogurei TaxID=1889778 RepID=A0A2G5K4M3_9RHOB|nr:alpha/beta hydrolase [Amylibacter kogurei]PIB23963.1 hydrolase [Amylibacter kogurei]
MKFFKTSDGLKIAYREHGSGVPILCLSGLTRNSTDFDYMTPHINNARLIAMDYRGREQSDFDPNFENYSIEREGKDALELLDHLGLYDVGIIGTSRGGLIGMGLAAAVPARLRGLLMNDIGPVLEPDGLSAIMGFLGRRPKFKTYDEAAAALPTITTGFVDVPPDRWQQEVRNRWEERADGLHLRYDPKLRDAIEGADHSVAPDMWPFFDALTDKPIALIRGENSDLLSRDTVTEMQKRRPDMIYVEAKNRAHIPYLDEPESLDVINKFIKAIS